MTDGGAGSRFLIASLGSIGRRHLRNLRTLRPAATIAALRRPGSDDALPDGCDVQFTSTQDAIAFGPAAAILAGPAPTHVPLAMQFVEHGIPVLIEKPLSHDLENLAALAESAGRHDVPVMVGYNLRFATSLAAVREELRAARIGQVWGVRAEVGQYLPSWRPDADYRQGVSAQQALGGGALLELSHEIDYVYWLFGLPDRVTCTGGRLSSLDIDVEDCVEISLEYADPRRLISVHMDFLQRPTSRRMKIMGDNGTLEWDALEHRVVTKYHAPELVIEQQDFAQSGPADTYLEELGAFLASVEAGAPVPIPLRQGIDVMRVVAAARMSLSSRRTVEMAEVGTGS